MFLKSDLFSQLCNVVIFIDFSFRRKFRNDRTLVFHNRSIITFKPQFNKFEFALNKKRVLYPSFAKMLHGLLEFYVLRTIFVINSEK